MKRILSLLICLAIVISSVSVIGVAADSEHWAYNEITSLISDGIISGDQNGNLNLDNKITRAEFIKTVNKYFGFTKMAETNFSDVKSDSWYYNEMLIAKGEGYVKGDDNGNGNPDSFITRAEVSVIIARLLNLEENKDCDFSDKADIPEWAIGAVGALTKKGILNGYSDGTFKAGNSILRGEAFVVIKRNDKTLPDNKEEVKEEKPTEKPTTSGGGGGGGGGTYIPSGGSSGGTSGGTSGGGLTEELKASLSKRDFNTESGKLAFVAQNASSYKIRFSFKDIDKKDTFIEEDLTVVESGDYITAQFAGFKAKVLAKSRAPYADAVVSVMALGKNADYKDSGYVEFGNVVFKVDIPDVTGVVATRNDTTGEWTITWDNIQDVVDYKVSFYSDEKLENEIEALSKEPVNETSYKVTQAQLGDIGNAYYVTVSAKAEGFYGTCDTHSAVVTSGFDGGFGTEKSPYIIRTANQFKTAFAKDTKAPNATDTYYLLTGFDTTAMTLTDYKPMTDAFSGHLIGGNINNGVIENVIQKINVTSELTKEDKIDSAQGVIFHKLQNATVKNIELTGSVSAEEDIPENSYFGGFVGYLSGTSHIENIMVNYKDGIKTFQETATGGIVGTAGGEFNKIVNCKNYSDIVNGNEDISNVGGIIGDAIRTEISGCYNFGNITAKNNVGGISGIHKDNSNDKILTSGNYGTITALNGLAGGIVGGVRCAIDQCFNVGDVKATTYAAGIAGEVPKDKTSDITNCYNLGKIEQGEKTVIGLVVGKLGGKATVKNFYDIGNKDAVKVAGEVLETGILTVESAYSYGAEKTQDNDVDKVSIIYLKNLLKNDANFTSDIWGTITNYSYPGFKNNSISQKDKDGKEYKGNEFVKVKLSINDINYDKVAQSWFISIEPTGIGTPDSYKVYIGGNEVLNESEKTKYVLPKDKTPNVDDEKEVVVEAIENGNVIDSATANQNFKLDRLDILDISCDEEEKWYMTIAESGIGVTSKYELYFGDSLKKTLTNVGSETKFDITDIIEEGTFEITLKAFAEGNNEEAFDSVTETMMLSKDKVKVKDIYFDTDSWYISLKPSELDGKTTTSYKVIFTNEEDEETFVIEVSDPNEEPKYKIETNLIGEVSVKVEVYDNEEKFDECVVAEEYDLTFAGGHGTEGDPYIIRTAKQFKTAFSNDNKVPNTNDTYYLLTGFDETAMVLTGYTPMNVLNANLIGGNMIDGRVEPKVQKINFGTFTTDDSKYVPDGDKYFYQGVLFNDIQGATVENISLEGTVTVSELGNGLFGALSGRAVNATINKVSTNVAITSYLFSGNSATAGIIGSLQGESILKNCINYGNITVAKTYSYCVAGIVGKASAGVTISDCVNYGTIKSKNESAGIIGWSSDNEVTNCANYGNIIVENNTPGSYFEAAAIIGRANGNITLNQCFNAGSIDSKKYAGGLVGIITAGKILNVNDSYNIGKITGDSACGLVVGENQGTLNVKGFYDIGNVNVESVAGVKGTLDVKGVYSYGKTDSNKDNDADKVSLVFIKDLLTNDSANFLSSVWGANDEYSYPGLLENKIEKGNSYITIKVAITNVSYDKNKREWFVEISPTGKSLDATYQLFNGDTVINIESVSDNKYKILDNLSGNISLTAKAIYGENEIECSDPYSNNFDLQGLQITDIYRQDKKWYITFTPSEIGNAKDYKLFIGNDEIAIKEDSDGKYQITGAVTEGTFDVTLKAFAEGEADAFDSATKNNVKFELGKVAVRDIFFDKDSWYISIEPSEKGEATEYKIILNDGAETITAKANDENKYEITTTLTGAISVKVEAWNDNSAEPIDYCEAKENYDFTFAGGHGLESDPYIIRTAEQFKKAFGTDKTFVECHFVLTGFDVNPLVLTDYKPIKDAFKGTLIGDETVKDENGNIVKQKISINSNLKPDDYYDVIVNVDKNQTYSYSGAIFNYIDSATIKNLELGKVYDSTVPTQQPDKVEAARQSTVNGYFGTLVGYMVSSTIENVDNRIYVDSSLSYTTAGLIGSTSGNENKVTNCNNYGEINGKSRTAGVIGDKFKVIMTKCYNYGAIKGTTSCGGLVGDNKSTSTPDDTIKYCGNYGSVEATDAKGTAGGITGRARKGVENCFNAGKVTAYYAGGIIGEASSNTPNVIDCFNVGELKGTYNGLVIGYLKTVSSTITNFYDAKNSEVVSLVGLNEKSITQTNIYDYSAKDTIKGNPSKLGSVWQMSTGYNYPDLVKNSIVLNNKTNVVLPE